MEFTADEIEAMELLHKMVQKQIDEDHGIEVHSISVKHEGCASSEQEQEAIYYDYAPQLD